jgi:hypothetical protein
MAKLTVNKKPEFVRGSQLGLDERPAEYTFGFESAKSKVGAGTSVLTHLAVIGVLLLIFVSRRRLCPPRSRISSTSTWRYSCPPLALAAVAAVAGT